MPRYRTTSRRTEEEKMKLKVDLRCIPEWEAELEVIGNRCRFNLQKVSAAATLIHEMRVQLLYARGIRERQELEKWKKTLTADKLIISMGSSYTYNETRPVFLRQSETIVGHIRSVLKEAEDYLTQCKVRGVTDNFWVSLFTEKMSAERSGHWERMKAKFLPLTREIPRIEEALRTLEEVRPQALEYETRVRQITEQLSLAEEKRAAIARFEAKHGKALAKGAAADNKTRKRVTNLKVVVKKTKDCPYCGGDLGVDPHLDHIYPVTKGGLSIVENLIWCCSTCNGLKSDKGLMQFLKEQGLPIDQTLTRLHSLGKHV